MAAEKVLGKVIAANDEKICVWPARLIELSLMAADAFKMCHYDIESVKNTSAYLRYQKMLHLYEECGHNENVFLEVSKEDR